MIGDAGEERVFARADRLLKGWVSINFDAGFPNIIPGGSILFLKSSNAPMRSLLGFRDGICFWSFRLAASNYCDVFYECAGSSGLYLKCHLFSRCARYFWTLLGRHQLARALQCGRFRDRDVRPFSCVAEVDRVSREIDTGRNGVETACA